MGASQGKTIGALVLVTLFWGLSFPLMRQWQDQAGDCPGGRPVASLTLITLRMLPAVVLLAAFQPRLVRQSTARAHRAGTAVGLVFLAGFVFQVIGLAHTSPARSAFATSLSSAWVPLLVWACDRQRPAMLTLFGLGLGLAGAGVLAAVDETPGHGNYLLGDVLTLIASGFFGVQVVLLNHLARRIEPSHVSLAFLGVAGLAALLLAVGLAAVGPGVRPWAAWTLSMLGEPWVMPRLGLLVVFSTVLGFHLMNVYQPRVTPSRAALVYLLEPVFASLISIPLGLDQLTMGLVAGGALILGGNMLVELPDWLRERHGR
jgi:drug/metabolite transporter (DMT)-like permease